MSSFGEKDKRKAFCFNCNREQRVDTLFEDIDEWRQENDEDYVYGATENYCFKCRGCESTFMARASWFSEEYEYVVDASGNESIQFIVDFDFLPAKPKAIVPRVNQFEVFLFDARLSELLAESYLCIENEILVASAASMRTVFERASKLLGVSEELSFKEKLVALKKNGHISGSDISDLEVLIEAGSAAIHRGWKPKKADILHMLSILNPFLEANFIRRAKSKKLNESIPKKKA